MFLLALRACFGILVIGVGYLAMDASSSSTLGILFFLLMLAVGVGTIYADMRAKNKDITTISAVMFGSLLGLLLGTLFSTALEPVVRAWGSASKATASKLADGTDATAKAVGEEMALRDAQTERAVQIMRLLITAICCYAAISVLMQTKDEFRFIIPYVEFAKQLKGSKPLVLDTSVIIDGRIADICDTRIVDTKLIVPRFVLQELQGIADSSDKLKRNRGRRGLDILKRLQTNPKIELQMHEANLAELRDVPRVDERLVVFAKVFGARVVTNDFNLNKIAQLQGVDVINLNEVANALKTVALPGEGMMVRLVKSGDQPGQGVGYLDDGTMVVVEQGRPQIGHEVNIVVTSVLQTPAGRMIFGRLDNRPPGAGSSAEMPRLESH